MDARGVIRIDHPAALREVLEYAWPAQDLARPRIELHFPVLSPDECSDFEARINRHWTACGCETATFAALAALAVYAAAVAIDAPWLPSGWLELTALGAGVAVAGGVAGKHWGLARAQRQLRSATSELFNRLSVGP